MKKCCGECTHGVCMPYEEPCKTCMGAVSGYSKFNPKHSCYTCKHKDKGMCENPCDDCSIRLRLDRWEEGE